LSGTSGFVRLETPVSFEQNQQQLDTRVAATAELA
jgi:hypothetical protein